MRQNLNYERISLYLAASFPILLLIVFVIFPALFPLGESALEKDYVPSYQLYDRNGFLLRESANPQGYHAIWVDLEDFDPFLIKAVLAAEDERFYKHNGIDFIAMARAFSQNLRSGEVQSGASTITMQLARILRGQSHNIFGKISQMVAARRLEQGLSKDEILVQYLNRVSMGKGNLGINAASKEYFKIDHYLMSQSQMCLLAGIIQGPGIYNPLDAPIESERRRNYVINRLVENTTLTEQEAEWMKQEAIITSENDRKPEAMHFTDYVLSQKPPAGRVDSSLDIGMNRAITKLIQMHVDKYGNEGLEHGAAIVLDNETMGIRAMVGSPDYWDKEMGSNNGATMLRQPGSTLKPFTYGLALEQGWQPGSILADIPINYQGKEGRIYQPENITQRYSGPVMLQDALSRSLNIPAIQMANQVGLENLLKKLRECGFETLDQPTEFYGLGLTLGNGEVRLIDLAEAYAMWANKGIYRRSTWEPSPPEEGRRVFEEETAYLITEILSNTRLRIHAFGANNPLLMNFPISIKTGTSENWRDNWVVGYTKQFTIAVWVGSFAGDPTNQFSATEGAGPLFHQIADLVNNLYPQENRNIWETPPEDIVQIEVCSLSGHPPNEFCPTTLWVDFWDRGNRPAPCDMHREVKIVEPSGREITRVFEYLPAEYSNWEASLGRIPPPDPTSAAKYGYNRVHITITQPQNGERYLVEPGYNLETQSIELKAETLNNIPFLEWIVNGELLQKSEWPYTGYLPTRPGKYKIQAVYGSEKSEEISIEIF